MAEAVRERPKKKKKKEKDRFTSYLKPDKNLKEENQSEPKCKIDEQEKLNQKPNDNLSAELDSSEYVQQHAEVNIDRTITSEDKIDNDNKSDVITNKNDIEPSNVFENSIIENETNLDKSQEEDGGNNTAMLDLISSNEINIVSIGESSSSVLPEDNCSLHVKPQENNKDVASDSIRDTDNVLATAPVLSLSNVEPTEENKETVKAQNFDTTVRSRPFERDKLSEVDIKANTYENVSNVVANTRQSEIVHKKVFTVNLNEEVESDKVVPFTEEQLTQFYKNSELEQLEFFVDEFLKNSSDLRYEFYDIVNLYYKSRTKLVEIQKKIESTQDKVKNEQKNVWEIKQCICTAEGICACGVSVMQQQKYQQAVFKEEHFSKMSENMSHLRGFVHELHQLECYNSHVSKIRVDNYLCKLFKHCPAIKNLSADHPLTAYLPHNIDSNVIPVLRELQDCISVLFIFKRYGILEEQFTADLDSWLNMLVAVLQRIGTLPDSFFLLNHLLRSPPGTVSSMSHFIQFPSFEHPLLCVWDRPQIHHFVVMLATLTLPVRFRKEYLSKYEMNRKGLLTKSISWILMDEDKEEDEDMEDGWCLMQENDLIAIFDQFSFNSLLASLLNIEVNEGVLSHSPSLSSSNDMIRLLAYSSCLVKLLGKIFDTYNMLRYRQFIKQISRTIRLITQVISDHWISYKNYRINVVGDRLKDLPKMSNMALPQMSLERLQVEFDQFFLRSSFQIISSHSAGAIQFLSTMPFEAVSLSSMWIMLHMILGEETNFAVLSTRGPDDLPCITSLEVSPSEGIFLLTALSNMAISRPSEDSAFIETVAKLVLEVSFLNASVTDLYSKNGHDLLASIAAMHPSSITALVQHANKLRNQLQKVLSYIFDSMPICTWRPTSSDFEIIRTWLLQFPLSSEENLLARMLLHRLNYSYSQDDMHLFLPRSVHFMIAILLVEAYGVSFPDYAGGIQKLNYAALGIIQQVSKMAVSSYNKIMYSQAHTEFLAWAWDVMIMLKLHDSDIVHNNSEEDEREEQSIAGEDQFGPNVTWCHKTISQLKDKRSFELELESSPELLNVHLAVESNGMLAVYEAFAMTKSGHFVDQFLEKGMKYLVLLKDASHYDAVMRIISNIAPLFLNCPEKLTNDSFLKILNTLIHIDVNKAGYTEKLWQYFIAGTYSQKLTALITAQVLKSKEHSDVQAHKSIKFWIHLLLRLPYWSRDCGVLYQMDNLCKVSFTVPGGLDILLDYFYHEHREVLLSSQTPRGLLSSVMSWISTSNQPISYMLTPTTDFCYYAYVILSTEMKFEEEIGLWKEIATEMSMNTSIPLEQAYKKAISSIKSFYMPPLNYLSIYRWGEQAMATPKDHPFLPIIWQKFFLIFLQKPSEESGLPSRVGIGLRFFENFSSASVAKRMKTTLYSIASYHQDKGVARDPSESQCSKNSSWNMTEKEHVYSEHYHQTLSKLYQGLALWLEESRLHDSNLYLTSLPDVYNPDLLLKIFQGNKDLWHDYMDSATLLKEIETLSSLWVHSVYQPVNLKKPADSVADIVMQVTAGQKITKRLNDETKPAPPPPVVVLEPPVAEISYHILLTRPRLVQDVGNDLEVIVRYAKSASTLMASHVGLDAEFIELLPDLYDMVTRSVAVWIPCDGRKKQKKGGCIGPAQCRIQFRELHLRDRIATLLNDNRNASKELIKTLVTSTPVELCLSVVHVENIVAKLAEGFDTLNNPQRLELQDSARKMFYLLAQLIDDDVKRCPPAIQFFSTEVEKLGKKFITDHSTEQLPLLDAILNQNSSIMFLAPHFAPINSPENFVKLYSKIVTFMNAGNETTVFVLFSKFDMGSWLASNPALLDRREMVALIMTALCKIGAQPNTEELVVLEVIRGHMITLLSSNVEEYFSKVLQELLNGSSSSSIATICWSDFVACLGYDKQQSPRANESSLSVGQIKETIPFIAGYFQNNVDQVNHHLDALYEVWNPYIKQVNMLLFGLLQRNIVHEMNLMNEYNKDQILHDLWETIVAVYQPLILPRTPGKIWSLLRIESVLAVIQSFIEAVRLVIDLHGTENGYCGLLNVVWTYYFVSIVPAVKEEQSLELFHSLLTILPWSLYCPAIQELSCVLQAHDAYPSAFRFLGSLLAEINWPSVVTTYLESGNKSDISRLHQQLLNIFVMMASDKIVLDTSASKLVYLFTAANTFKWNTLGLEDAAHALKWYSENADSTLILEKDSYVWSTLGLIKEVCCYHGNEETNDIVTAKRNLYVNVVVTLLTRCVTCQHRIQDFRFVVYNLLRTVESTIAYNSVKPMEELVYHACTCLNLFNTISSGPVFDVIKSTIETYLLESQCGMIVLSFISAVSRSLASIEQMISLLETAISCHFFRLADDELRNAWLPILQAFVVPELNISEFVQEALKQKALLTLYSYNLHRIPQAESPGEQLNILTDAVQWCTRIQPDKGSESKIILLWLQIFDIVRMQISQHQNQQHIQVLAKNMLYLSYACQIHGEDKTYSGVLGAIGIGRKSALTKEFRFAAKMLHLFLLCQLPTSGGVSLRYTINAPGAIRILYPTDSSSRATAEAEKAFSNVESFLKNKAYQSMKEQVKWVLGFVGDSQYSIIDGCSLLVYLCKQFFDKENFIAATVV